MGGWALGGSGVGVVVVACVIPLSDIAENKYILFPVVFQDKGSLYIETNTVMRLYFEIILHNYI